jgi:hydrocephalus-inducing protein
LKVYESTLWFRNNDNVPRRVKVEDPKSRHFSVQRVFKKVGWCKLTPG